MVSFKLVATVRTTRGLLSRVQRGTVSEAEILYSHFILSKLDSKTLRDFNASLSHNDIPHLDALLAWLERQAKSLDLTQEIRQTTSPLPFPPLSPTSTSDWEEEANTNPFPSTVYQTKPPTCTQQRILCIDLTQSSDEDSSADESNDEDDDYVLIGKLRRYE